MFSFKLFSIIVVLVTVFNYIQCQQAAVQGTGTQPSGGIRDRIKCGRILTRGVKTCKDTHFPGGAVPAAISDGACCTYKKFSTCVDGLRDGLKAELQKEKCGPSTISEAIRSYGANVVGSLKTRCDLRDGKDPCLNAKSKKAN